MTLYQTRISRLREFLKKEKLDYFLFADADGHFSEYVGDYFKMRTAFSGFTGSNGTLLVGRDKAYLWTDGRYFIQAEKELDGSGIVLMKMGMPGVPGVSDFILQLP
ncbi:MAG: aminopeptidase P family N-terminal domain-containing protein [Lachnospiraceae bacterium]|nr:aminopeptidase P family N-terminal domain-containing protein [Lachnospiraceae bacterium]